MPEGPASHTPERTHASGWQVDVNTFLPTILEASLDLPTATLVRGSDGCSRTKRPSAQQRREQPASCSVPAAAMPDLDRCCCPSPS
jgi:hypothetical protein